tara:strand:- start:268 stop:1146 length:879 start_codon:yes stop_codon:yes gene_type:complete
MEMTTTELFAWKPLYIIPVGDIQLGADGVDVEALKEDIKRGMDLHNAGEQVRFIGLGDYVDADSPSGRQKTKAAGFYDSHMAALDEVAEIRIGELLRYFRKTTGLWLGIHHGHHYHDFGDGTITDTRLAGHLGAKYLKTTAITRIRFQRTGRSGSGGSTITTDVYSQHGSGGGQTQAAPINRLERLSGGIDADLYLTNHSARRGVVPRDKLFMSNSGKLRAKTIQMMMTGGYMKAYSEGAGRIEAGYVEKAGMTPTSIGGGIAKLIPVRKTPRNPDTGKQEEILSVKIEVTV